MKEKPEEEAPTQALKTTGLGPTPPPHPQHRQRNDPEPRPHPPRPKDPDHSQVRARHWWTNPKEKDIARSSEQHAQRPRKKTYPEKTNQPSSTPLKPGEPPEQAMKDHPIRAQKIKPAHTTHGDSGTECDQAVARGPPERQTNDRKPSEKH
ncbi:unnamed protein product [Pleuronectes platessa]|uniref:Uncharacterized protein n=1 Tax=Pleuronectes platessa TaxID=8262 RepID=A0A9N7V119_PLEPL|nr:unnamed protein product [Pleuronectes platessa]